MALFTESVIRQRGRAEVQKASNRYSAESIILDSVRAFSETKTYDIFLSHSVRDAELILGMKATFEALKYSVYVDWIEDPQLDRSKVSSTTADKLRKRMDTSKSLFYVTTQNAESSRWMPWECGYFDGKKGKSAIVPIVNYSYDNNYKGQEYLGLYPYIVEQPNRFGKQMLWVRKSDSLYIAYDDWVKKLTFDSSWQEG
jgi:hypothetical protein